MWLTVNCILLMIATVVLVSGIDFFIKNKKTNNNTRYYVLFYSIFSAIWCISYGVIGITDNLELAANVRSLGVVAINGFYITEAFLVSGMSKCKKEVRFITRAVAVLLSLEDVILFTNRKMDIFVRISNWTTWYTNPQYAFIRTVHTVSVLLMMLNLFIAGIIWLKSSELKRHKKFVSMAFIANFTMMFFAIPDTFLPIFGMAAVPTSGIGAALCTLVIWYGAEKYNSFDIQRSNVLNNVFDFMNAGIMVMDSNYEIALVNPYSESIIPDEKSAKCKLEDIFYLEDICSEQICDIAQNDIYSNRFEAKKDGKFYSIRVTAAKDDYNEPYCYFCVLSDVTNELNMVKELEFANNAKTKFLTNISHEIRTPINAILGFNEMIIRQTNKPEIIHYSSNISRAGKMLLSIINDLLDMGQMSSGKIKLVPLEYSLSKVFSDVYTLQQLKAEEKGLTFTISNDEYIPNRLLGDALRIQQIITNLITNAVKYTQKGSVHVQVDYREKDENVIDLIISVRDTGMGIKEEDLPYLYNSFQRFDEEKNRHIEGTGIGLAITHNLVEAMGGKIEVQSAYGIGSCFTVTIPQEVVGREPVGIIGNYIDEEKKDHSVHFTAPEANVIAIDDNEMNLMVFAGSLKHLGMNIETANSGFELLNRIKQKKYDIIFLDHMMPEMDGIETRRRMLENKEHLNQDTPVIVMTANTIRGAKEQYLASGFTDYVGKPAEISVLEELVKHYLKPELVRYAGSDTTEKVDDKEDLFPRVEGVDWSMAFKNMPDSKLLLEIVKTFYLSAAKEVEFLNQNYQKIKTEKDEEALNAYRIKVHSMKNSAALVGAEEISLQARELEYASRDLDIPTIINKHTSFAQAYNSLAERLRVAITGEKSENVVLTHAMNSEMLKNNLTMMEDAMKEFDMDSLNEMVFALDDYTFETEEISEKIKSLQESVRDFDQELFFKTAEELRNILV